MRIGSKSKEQYDQEQKDAQDQATARREHLLLDIQTWSTYQIAEHLFPFRDPDESDEVLAALRGRFMEISATEQEFGDGSRDTCEHGHQICQHGFCVQMCVFLACRSPPKEVS